VINVGQKINSAHCRVGEHENRLDPWRPPDFLRVGPLETPPPPDVKRAPVGAEG
jgi:hypothetical protein